MSSGALVSPSRSQKTYWLPSASAIAADCGDQPQEFPLVHAAADGDFQALWGGERTDDVHGASTARAACVDLQSCRDAPVTQSGVSRISMGHQPETSIPRRGASSADATDASPDNSPLSRFATAGTNVGSHLGTTRSPPSTVTATSS